MMFNKLIFMFLLTKFGQIKGILPSEYKNVLNICDDPKDQCPFHFHELFVETSVSTYLGDRLTNIQKIMDCGSVIWQATTSETRLSVFKLYRWHHLNKLAFVYTITRSYHRTRFFEKRGYNWLEVTHSFFDYKLNKLTKERILDLKEYIDPRLCYVEEHHLYGLPATVIIPRTKYEIITVQYDYDILWERSYGSGQCSCVIIHGTFKKPKLIHIHAKHIEYHEEVFYVYSEKTFKKVTKNAFYLTLNYYDKIEQEQENQDSSDESS